MLWRHCHTGHDCEVHTSSAASLVIIGDAFHTFVDGALIAAAVLTSIPLGATTAIAVAAHEIPQEVGDFAILLRAGYSRSRAFTLNILSATGGVLGALAMLPASQTLPNAIPYVLSFAAGSFLYVAMSDLIPDLHRGGLEGGPGETTVADRRRDPHHRAAVKRLTAPADGLSSWPLHCPLGAPARPTRSGDRSSAPRLPRKSAHFRHLRRGTRFAI